MANKLQILLQTYDLPHFERYAPELGIEIREPSALQPRLIETDEKKAD
jgi:hypothetical protein